MKILFVIETLSKGGAEYQLLNLCGELTNMGLECHVVFLFDRDDNLISSFREFGIKVFSLKIKGKWNVLSTTFRLRKIISKNSYDLVHAHLFHAVIATSILRILRLSPPTLATFHNRGYDSYPPHTCLKKVRRYLDGLITRNGISYSTAVSKAVMESTSRHLGVKNIKIIGNGVNLSSIENVRSSSIDQTRSKYGVPLDIITFILPGRLVWEKGHNLFLQSLANLLDYKKKFHAVIVGSGPLEKEILNEIAVLGLSDHITFIPGLPQTELFELIYAADVAVIPSVMEGWGMVVAESMALGKPLVCSSAGGIPDVLGDLNNAVVVEPGNPSELCNALKLVFDDQQLRQSLSQKSLKRSQELSIESVAMEYIQMYKKISTEY